MRLSEVEHQERAISILRRALRSGRTHHAYLFEGPEGVGKELAAQGLAARLLCEKGDLAPDADACGECVACRLLAGGNHPDFHLIHRGLHKLHPDARVRSSKGLFLVVDLIRHFLIEPAALKPTRGRRRVFLVRDAERMNEEAQNALLKTLEEPPGEAALILVTASAARLLPTIRSRCQSVPFGLLPRDYVADRLVDRASVSAQAARALAVLADGRLGVALRWQRMGLLESVDTVGAWVGQVRAAGPESFAKALIEVAGEFALKARQAGDESEGEEDGGEAKAGGKSIPTDELRDALKLVLMLVAAIYRDGLLAASGAGRLRGLPGQRQRTEALAEAAGPGEIDACLRAVRVAEQMLDRNVAPQLVLERLAVALLGELAAT